LANTGLTLTVENDGDDRDLDSSIPNGESKNLAAVGLIFTIQQRALLDALNELNDGRLANWFVGALTVILQDNNPDRIPQAAHSMRELMEKLPQDLDVAIPNIPTALKERTRQLNDRWKRIQRRTKGVITRDGLTNDFLERLQVFFQEFEREYPSRHDLAKQIIAEVDPAGLPLPRVVQDQRADTWVELTKYFNNVSHHRYESNIAEMIRMIEKLEAFLLDFLQPRTVDSQAKILELIQEGEGRDSDNS